MTAPGHAAGRPRRSRSRAWLACLALAALAPAARGADAVPPARAATPAPPRPARRERIELRVTFRPWESGGTFRMETSTHRVDQGAARDSGGFSGSGGGVRRVLEGERGTLVLRLQGKPRPGQPPIFGRWTLAYGTGAYAGMSGGGTFTALSGGDRRGASPHELQFLVGFLVRER